MHDFIFLMGDMNFRINMPNEEARENCQLGNIRELVKADQLINNKPNYSYLDGFREHLIEFMPTFKFDPGCDVYDTSKKQRTPSYTDRILFKGQS